MAGTPSSHTSPQNSIKYTGSHQPENGATVKSPPAVAGAPKVAPKIDLVANTQLKGKYS